MGFQMRGTLRLCRPLNCLMSGIAVVIAALISVSFGITSFWLPVLLATIVAILLTATGNILNDYTDREIDKISHPDRPIPSGKIKPTSALKLAVSLIIISLILSWFINIACFLIAINSVSNI